MSRSARTLAGVLLLLLPLSLLGCQRAPADNEQASGAILVVSTTTMLADLVAVLGGNAVDSRSIIAVGSDPHLYQPLPADAMLIARSGLVVRNGLHLEGWIDDLLANAGGVRALVTASDGVDTIEAGGAVDPHFWFDASLWKVAAGNVHEGLRGVIPAEEHDALQTRLRAFEARCDVLHQWATEQVQSLPEAQRVLVTSHDAFAYFGRAYQMDVHAVQGISTQQEASQRDVLDVISVVRERHLPAVFGETSVSAALIEQVARQTDAELLGPLYSDSLGTPESDAATWEDMFIYNVCAIINGLGGECAPPQVQAGGE
jgi:ABC-type Zn uptake system ZnuABC Zn-binding protein ZnuA